MLPRTVDGIFGAALDLYRRYPIRVAVLALLVFLPVAEPIMATLVTSALLHITIYAVGGVAVAVLGVSLILDDGRSRAGTAQSD